MTRSAQARARLRLAGLAAAMALTAGCGTPSLHQARSDFYAGKYAAADKTLRSDDLPAQDKVLILMERGTIRQAAQDYDASSRDYIQASDELDRLETWSVSQGGASMVANDMARSYRGAPFEWTLLHTFTALNHLALSRWEHSAVEARRILESLSPERLGDYPDDPFSRYMAGFCLQMIGDPSNASLQYQKAGKLAKRVAIDERTGRLADRPAPATNGLAFAVQPAFDLGEREAELVCFVLLGRSPSGEQVQGAIRFNEPELHVELRADGKALGRSYELADTVDLAFTTQQKEAIRKMVKTAARVAVKEGIAREIERNNELLGALVRFVLIGLLEQPDVRRWETLPRSLQIARVPCPPDLESYEAVVKTSTGAAVKTMVVDTPITRNGPVFFSFLRDLPSAGSPAP